MSRPRLLDLFSGIGAFSLAAHWLGWETVGFSEIDPFCVRVLKHHWPGVPQLGDIREIDGTIWRGRVDIVTGGVPCQPASVAGKRKGSEDDRWLWPEFFRVVRECRPRYVVAENVPGLIGLRPHGLDWICDELEGAGYQCVPVVLGASDIGAPHKRKRVWIVCRLADTIGGRNGEPNRDAIHAGRFTSEAGRACLPRGRNSPECDAQPAGEDGLADATSGRWYSQPLRSTGAPERVGPAPANTPSETGTLADARDGLLPQPGRGTEGRDGAGSAGAALGHSAKGRVRRGAAQGGSGQPAQSGEGGMADACRTDGRGRSSWAGRRERSAEDVGGEQPAGSTLPGLGHPAHELPGWMARFVARPGEPQHEWEAPRTSKGEPERAAKLKALGNSCVPTCAWVILRAIQDADREL